MLYQLAVLKLNSGQVRQATVVSKQLDLMFKEWQCKKQSIQPSKDGHIA